MSRQIIVDDPVVADLLTRLPGAAVLGHSKRSFLEHLLCTWRILADWQMPVAVCRAGFMHSAYSTSFYPHALFRLDQREVVRSMIGREAEALAFRFCTMDRRGFWDRLAQVRSTTTLSYPNRLRDGAPVRVSRKTLGRLLIIESANIAEQSRAEDNAPALWMSRVLGWWQFFDDASFPLLTSVRPSLTRRSDEAAIFTYRLALKLPVRQAIPLLDDSIKQNPWAGEPRILRALCALDTNDVEALSHERKGRELLSAWAVPWDKRLTVAGWKALADRIRGGSNKRRPAALNFESIRAILAGRLPGPRWLVLKSGELGA